MQCGEIRSGCRSQEACLEALGQVAEDAIDSGFGARACLTVGRACLLNGVRGVPVWHLLSVAVPWVHQAQAAGPG